MAEFTEHKPGTHCWVDVSSPDVEASRTFYQEVFGWQSDDQFDEAGNLIYTLFRKDGKIVAGLGGKPPGMEELPAIWNNYIASADVAENVVDVIEAGGLVLMPPMQIGTSGEMAVFADSTGAPFSVWKAGDHIGAELCNEPDTYSWNELLTRDVESAQAFYRDVFGWEYEENDMGPMGTYHVVKGSEDEGNADGKAGMMTMPAEMPGEVPNHWMVYFVVTDLDESLNKAKGAGGEVVFGPQQIPIGTWATLHDGQGGSFSMMQPAEA